MDFNDLLKSIALTEESVLARVDEYSLYCFYTGIEDLKLNRVYPAPYRPDPLPSFVVFTANRSNGVEYLWKDHGKGEVGNIFTLVKRMCNLNSRMEVLARISNDFGLGHDVSVIDRPKIVLYERPSLVPIKIRVADTPFTKAAMEFWGQFDIDQVLLDYFHTIQIKWYWSYDGQQAPSWVPDPTFAYRIGEYYQIYSPYAEKARKFRNDYPENYFFGFLQLPTRGRKLIIDKSAKDVIFCKRLGFDAVCGKSETTMIPKPFMLDLLERFEEVYLMLDNDKAGRMMTERYLSLYPQLRPRFLDVAKDKTDACKVVGVNEVQRIVTGLLTT